MMDETRETLARVRRILEKAAEHAEAHPTPLVGYGRIGDTFCTVGHIQEVCADYDCDPLFPLVAAEIACVLPEWAHKSWLVPRQKIERWNDYCHPDGAAKAALFRAAIERMDNPNAS